MVSFKVVGLLCLVAAVHSVPAKEGPRSARNNVFHTEDDLLDSVYADCLQKDTLACVKYKIYNFVDKLGGQKDIAVADGIEIVKTKESDTKDDSRSINGDETVESLIFSKIQRFVESHTFKIDLKGSEFVETVNSAARSIGDVLDENDGVEEGRGKKKKVKKVLGPLLALAGLKMAILGKVALAIIGFIAVKALFISKIALVIGAVILFRKIFSGGNSGGHVSHEVVAHPHHISHDSGFVGSGVGYSADVSGGHGGWQRAFDPQQVAYKAYAPTTESS